MRARSHSGCGSVVVKPGSLYANHRVLKGSRKFVHKLKQYLPLLLTQSYAHAFFPAISIPLSAWFTTESEF